MLRTKSSSKQIDAPGITLELGGKQERFFPGKSQEPSIFVAKRFQKSHTSKDYTWKLSKCNRKRGQESSELGGVAHTPMGRSMRHSSLLQSETWIADGLLVK